MLAVAMNHVTTVIYTAWFKRASVHRYSQDIPGTTLHSIDSCSDALYVCFINMSCHVSKNGHIFHRRCS